MRQSEGFFLSHWKGDAVALKELPVVRKIKAAAEKGRKKLLGIFMLWSVMQEWRRLHLSSCLCITNRYVIYGFLNLVKSCVGRAVRRNGHNDLNEQLMASVMQVGFKLCYSRSRKVEPHEYLGCPITDPMQISALPRV